MCAAARRARTGGAHEGKVPRRCGRGAPVCPARKSCRCRWHRTCPRCRRRWRSRKGRQGRWGPTASPGWPAPRAAWSRKASQGRASGTTSYAQRPRMAPRRDTGAGKARDRRPRRRRGPGGRAVRRTRRGCMHMVQTRRPQTPIDAASGALRWPSRAWGCRRTRRRLWSPASRPVAKTGRPWTRPRDGRRPRAARAAPMPSALAARPQAPTRSSRPSSLPRCGPWRSRCR